MSEKDSNGGGNWFLDGWNSFFGNKKSKPKNSGPTAEDLLKDHIYYSNELQKIDLKSASITLVDRWAKEKSLWARQAIQGNPTVIDSRMELPDVSWRDGLFSVSVSGKILTDDENTRIQHLIELQKTYGITLPFRYRYMVDESHCKEFKGKYYTNTRTGAVLIVSSYQSNGGFEEEIAFELGLDRFDYKGEEDKHSTISLKDLKAGIDKGDFVELKDSALADWKNKAGISKQGADSFKKLTLSLFLLQMPLSLKKEAHIHFQTSTGGFEWTATGIELRKDNMQTIAKLTVFSDEMITDGKKVHIDITPENASHYQDVLKQISDKFFYRREEVKELADKVNMYYNNLSALSSLWFDIVIGAKDNEKPFFNAPYHIFSNGYALKRKIYEDGNFGEEQLSHDEIDRLVAILTDFLWYVTALCSSYGINGELKTNKCGIAIRTWLLKRFGDDRASFNKAIDFRKKNDPLFAQSFRKTHEVRQEIKKEHEIPQRPKSGIKSNEEVTAYSPESRPQTLADRSQGRNLSNDFASKLRGRDRSHARNTEQPSAVPVNNFAKHNEPSADESNDAISKDLIIRDIIKIIDVDGIDVSSWHVPFTVFNTPDGSRKITVETVTFRNIPSDKGLFFAGHTENKEKNGTLVSLYNPNLFLEFTPFGLMEVKRQAQLFVDLQTEIAKRTLDLKDEQAQRLAELRKREEALRLKEEALDKERTEQQKRQKEIRKKEDALLSEQKRQEDDAASNGEDMFSAASKSSVDSNDGVNPSSVVKPSSDNSNKQSDKTGQADNGDSGNNTDVKDIDANESNHNTDGTSEPKEVAKPSSEKPVVPPSTVQDGQSGNTNGLGADGAKPDKVDASTVNTENGTLNKQDKVEDQNGLKPEAKTDGEKDNDVDATNGSDNQSGDDGSNHSGADHQRDGEDDGKSDSEGDKKPSDATGTSSDNDGKPKGTQQPTAAPAFSNDEIDEKEKANLLSLLSIRIPNDGDYILMGSSFGLTLPSLKDDRTLEVSTITRQEDDFIVKFSSDDNDSEGYSISSWYSKSSALKVLFNKIKVTIPSIREDSYFYMKAPTKELLDLKQHLKALLPDDSLRIEFKHLPIEKAIEYNSDLTTLYLEGIRFYKSDDYILLYSTDGNGDSAIGLRYLLNRNNMIGDTILKRLTEELNKEGDKKAYSIENDVNVANQDYVQSRWDMNNTRFRDLIDVLDKLIPYQGDLIMSKYKEGFGGCVNAMNGIDTVNSIEHSDEGYVVTMIIQEKTKEESKTSNLKTSEKEVNLLNYGQSDQDLINLVEELQVPYDKRAFDVLLSQRYDIAAFGSSNVPRGYFQSDRILKEEAWRHLAKLLVNKLRYQHLNDLPWVSSKVTYPRNYLNKAFIGANALLLALETEYNGFEMPVFIDETTLKKEDLRPVNEAIPCFIFDQDNIFVKVYNIKDTDLGTVNPPVYEGFSRVNNELLAKDSDSQSFINMLTNDNWIVSIITEESKGKSSIQYNVSDNFIHYLKGDIENEEESLSSDVLFRQLVLSLVESVDKGSTGSKFDGDNDRLLVDNLTAAMLGIQHRFEIKNSQRNHYWIDSLSKGTKYVREIVLAAQRKYLFIEDKMKEFAAAANQ